MTMPWNESVIYVSDLIICFPIYVCTGDLQKSIEYNRAPVSSKQPYNVFLFLKLDFEYLYLLSIYKFYIILYVTRTDAGESQNVAFSCYTVFCSSYCNKLNNVSDYAGLYVWVFMHLYIRPNPIIIILVSRRRTGRFFILYSLCSLSR